MQETYAPSSAEATRVYLAERVGQRVTLRVGICYVIPSSMGRGKTLRYGPEQIETRSGVVRRVFENDEPGSGKWVVEMTDRPIPGLSNNVTQHIGLSRIKEIVL